MALTRPDGGTVRIAGPDGAARRQPVTGLIGVVGLGLIGSSLARRLAGHDRAVTSWDRDPETRSAAVAAGLTVAPSLAALATSTNLLFVAVPLPAVPGVLAAIAAAAPAGTMLSDVTSVKEPVRALARHHRLTFVGGHPMAGTAESGFAAGSADLLAGAGWVLTLDEETDLTAWLTVARVVTGLGCRVVPATSAAHDAAVAKISHLPHLLAAALVLGAADDPLALSLAAGSFRDATRVAATRPALVAAMCAGNADELDATLARLMERLADARAGLRRPEDLRGWLAAAQVVRLAWPAVPSADRDLGAGTGLRERLLEAGAGGGYVVRVAPDGSVVVRVTAPEAHVSARA